MGKSLNIIMADISTLDVDCIVNAANSALQQGGGVCGAIFAAAGARQLQQACDMHGYCPTGQAVITPGFQLRAKFIVHAVGPMWQGGSQNEAQLLCSCYQNALELAGRNGCRTVAFPLISSGIYGYPAEEAWRIAIRAIQESPWELDVSIAVISGTALDLGNRILAQVGTPKASAKANNFVFFWRDYEEHGHFSQWFTAPFRVEGIRYLHCEQYMMAKKALLFGDTGVYCQIMDEMDPAACKALGKGAANFNQYLWDSCKEEIIYNANYAKFSQNPELKAALLATGDAILAEASPRDTIWGIGLKATDPDSQDPGKWPGQNLLGKALMKVRNELKKEA